MLIGTISSNTSYPRVLNPLVGTPSKAMPSSTATSTTATNASGIVSSNAPTGASSAKPSPGGHGRASGGGGASSSTTAETLVSSYSTNVGGTSYSGSVEKSGTEYTASVGNLPGASASGSSESAAENSLTQRIDELV